MEDVLHQSERLEHRFDWLGAADSYEKALSLLPERDLSVKADIIERRSYALYRCAFQAEDNERFNDTMKEAAGGYEEASECYGKTGGPAKTAGLLRCSAMIASISCCLASKASEKSRWLGECWTLTKEALKSLDEAGNVSEYCRTYDQLASRVHQLCSLEANPEVRERTNREAMELGERAIVLLSSVSLADELARAYVRVASELSTLADVFTLDMDEKDRQTQKGLDYWRKACEVAEEAAFVELLDPSCGVLGWNVDEIRVVYDKALGFARKTGDKRLTGTAFDFLAYVDFWRSMGTEDPEEKARLEHRALQYAEGARREFSLVSWTSSRGGVLWTAAPYAEYYYEQGRREADLKKRRALLEQAVANGTQATLQAESAGYLEIQMLENHVLSKALVALAHVEPCLEDKRRLLGKALEHRKTSIVKIEQLTPSHYWNRGAMTNYLADLQAELANVEEPEKAGKTLEEAVVNKELSLQLCVRYASYFEKTGDLSFLAALGGYYYSYGEMRKRLSELTNNVEQRRKAVEAYEEAAEAYKRLNLFSRMAECRWKAALGYDALGDHVEASQSFDTASCDYKNAAEKIPQLKELYTEQSVYMQAWSEIEKARHCHAKQDYESAGEHYDKASVMHKSLKQWSCLAPNYSAWAQLEKAEELSTRRQSDEAIMAFEEAARLFQETRESIEPVLSGTMDADEKTMMTRLMETTEVRRQYCSGRVALEEANSLDRNGEHLASSQKYFSAAATFEKIEKTLESEHERREIECVATLSQAWGKMTLAEADSSPSLYDQASQLFEQARNVSVSGKARTLALGHSRFCKALEEGTRYADTRDVAAHNSAVKYLQSASTYYVKAGFQEASEYAEATGKLLDAYVYMDNAKQESDPDKKARLYAVTEKVLQASANSYMKARHVGKREQVLRMLEKVREEREFALSLTEVLHPAPAVTTTTPFPTMWLTREGAVGLEKFQHAHVEANLRASRKELHPRENLELELDLVNAGKGSALLIRIEGMVPEGFELIEKPDSVRFENDAFVMKGKRLDALKTENFKVVVRPKLLGTFTLNPRISYLAEEGDPKTEKPEPVTVTVRELGIKGWLKGES